MKRLTLAIIVICCTATVEATRAQTWNRMYNLDLSSRKNWIVPSFTFGCKYEYDSTRMVGGKAPLHVICDNGFNLHGRVQLPKVSPDCECDVSLILRADTLHAPVTFDVEVIDDSERTIALRQIYIFPQSGRWQEYGVKLPRIAPVSELRIKLRYSPPLLCGKSELWIDRFVIRIDGEDIAQWDIAERQAAAPAALNPKHVVRLDFDDSKTDVTSRIRNLKKPRFVALGECTHGSASIQEARFRFCKDMIRNRKYRYLIFESKTIPMLAFDFYVQGYYFPNIERYMRLYETHPFYGTQFVDFIEWIRRYNLTHRQKVRILGMNTSYNDELSPFFRNLLPEDEAEICCRLIEERRFIELLNVVTRNERLHDAIGDDLFDMLVAILECSDFMLDPKQFEYNKRDLNMFRFIAELDNRVIPKKEKAVILAHTIHTSDMAASIESKVLSDRVEKNLGYYMRKKYSDDYFRLAFQVGQGRYLQDDNHDNIMLDDTMRAVNGFIMFADTLRTPIEGSFEQAAMKTGLEYLYYPSKYLDNNIVYMSIIGRKDPMGPHYRLLDLKYRHDGYIFIRNSRPHEYRINETN